MFVYAASCGCQKQPKLFVRALSDDKQGYSPNEFAKQWNWKENVYWSFLKLHLARSSIQIWRSLQARDFLK